MTTTKPESVYCGLDLHSSNTMAAIIDAQGQRIVHGKLPNRIEEIFGFLEPWKDRLQGLAVESTYNWYWLVDALLQADLPVFLGHPPAMTPYSGLKFANDRTDAYWLADLLRLGLFPAVYIYPRESRPLRDLLRRRMLLVEARKSLHISLSSMHARETGRTPKRMEMRNWETAQLEAAFPAELSRVAAEALLASAEALDQEIRKIETAAKCASKGNELLTRAMTLPGVGSALGMVISLETATTDRFASAENYASYCRTVPGHRSSNNKKKGEGNTRNGNKYLAWAWIEAAYFARAHYPRIKAWHDRKAAATNKIIAAKALACKLCKAGYYVMKDGTPFEESRLF
jgi:transposase